MIQIAKREDEAIMVLERFHVVIEKLQMVFERPHLVFERPNAWYLRDLKDNEFAYI